MSNKLNKKELRFAKKYPNLMNVLNSIPQHVEYRLVNGMLVPSVSGGGSGTTYTGTNGIVVNNTNHTIGMDDGSGATEAMNIGNAVIKGDLSLDKGAIFTAGPDAEVAIQCDCEITGSQFSVADTTIVSGLVKSLGNEAISGQPYHFTYYYDIQPTANNIGVTAYTITLDNNKTLTQYPTTINSATTTTAGVMSASDKTKLDGLLSFKDMFPVGAIWSTSDSTQDPNNIFSGTTWTLISTNQYIPSSTSISMSGASATLSGTIPVVGNGKTLAMTNGSNVYGVGSYNNGSVPYYGLYANQAGTNVGTSLGTGVGTNSTVGVPTSSQLGSSLENSGLVADLSTGTTTITATASMTATQVYMWKRTA